MSDAALLTRHSGFVRWRRARWHFHLWKRRTSYFHGEIKRGFAVGEDAPCRSRLPCRGSSLFAFTPLNNRPSADRPPHSAAHTRCMLMRHTRTHTTWLHLMPAERHVCLITRSHFRLRKFLPASSSTSSGPGSCVALTFTNVKLYRRRLSMQLLPDRRPPRGLVRLRRKRHTVAGKEV